MIPDGSYFISNILRLFWVFLKKRGEKTDNTLITIYVNKKQKTESHLKLFLKTFDSEFPYNDLWLADQNFETLEAKDKINITLFIK